MNIKKATLLGMLLAFGLSICSTYAVTVQDNQVTLVNQTAGTASIQFVWDGKYDITDKQPWGDSDHPNAVYMDNTATGTIIDIYCGRHGSSGPANWFNSQTGGSNHSMALNSTGAADELNFAISGTIIVTTANGKTYQYPICLGQGRDKISQQNNWWIGGFNFTKLNVDDDYHLDSNDNFLKITFGDNDHTFALQFSTN